MQRSLITLILILISSVVTAANLGKTLYDYSCSTCHAPDKSMAMKAPAAFDKSAWKIRYAKAEQEAKKNSQRYPTAMDYLVYSVTIGKGMMHPGGLCREAPKEIDCSKEAYVQAIQYMSH